MSALHSIWLMPARADEAALQDIVDDLAGRFPSPRFQPHLTLVEEQERDLDDLAAACRTAADDTARFSAAIETVDATDAYFRSLYARFEPEVTLGELRRKVLALAAPGAAGAFLPHISLLYGAESGPQKERTRAALAQDLVGRRITFDRICVVGSAKTIPVADWKVEYTAVLPAPQPSD
jgi:2'-5' RNA ligase